MTKGLERADTLPNFLLQQTNLYSQKQIDFWRIDPPTTNQPLVYVQYVQFVQFYWVKSMKYRHHLPLHVPTDPKSPDSVYSPIRDKPLEVDELVGTYQLSELPPMQKITPTRRRRLRKKKI